MSKNTSGNLIAYYLISGQCSLSIILQIIREPEVFLFSGSTESEHWPVMLVVSYIVVAW